MSEVLAGIDQVTSYQDDLLIMTCEKNEHDKVLEEVLGRLKSAGLKINHKKSEFFTERVEYLGHIFDADGVHPNQNKVRAILDAKAPTCKKEVQSLVGLCTYYMRYVKNCSTLFAPLYDLLNKDAKFCWKNEPQKCLDIIKNLFKTDLVLRNFDPKLPTVISVDASPQGIGACRTQNHEDGWFPTQFCSRKLNRAE